MTRRKTNATILALTLLATAAIYLNSLNNPFVPDDREIIFKNFRAGGDWRPTDLAGRSLFARDPSESAYFRPLTLLTFGLNYTFAKGRPGGYRAVNIALHLLVVSLIFLLLSRLTTPWVAASSSLLFALHPAHVQAVSYISSRSDPLYSALALSSLILWHKGSVVSGTPRQFFLSSALALFFLGLFAKETAVVVPPLAVAMDVAFTHPGEWRKTIKDNFFWYLGFLLLFGVYFSIRLAEGFPLTMEYGSNVGSGREVGSGLRLLHAVKLVALYIGVAFYPARLHLFRMAPPPQTLFEWEVIAGFLLLAVSALIIRLCWRSQREISFGILWFLISIVPVLNLIPLNADMMEHWLYLPLIGLVLACVGGIRRLAAHTGESRGAALGLVLVASLLSARTFGRNAEWSDLAKQFSQNVSAYPNHPTAWVWLAGALKDRGKWEEAIQAYKKALALRPNYSALVGLADVLSLTGRDHEAEMLIFQAASGGPQDPWLFHILAVQRLRMGNHRGALEAIQTNLRLRPSAEAYHISGSILLRMGETKAAEQAFQKAVHLDPGTPDSHAAVHMGLARLYRLQKRFDEAREEWRIALRFKPDHPEARALLEKQQ